jgi:hypothetical protein
MELTVARVAITCFSAVSAAGAAGVRHLAQRAMAETASMAAVVAGAVLLAMDSIQAQAVTAAVVLSSSSLFEGCLMRWLIILIIALGFSPITFAQSSDTSHDTQWFNRWRRPETVSRPLTECELRTYIALPVYQPVYEWRQTWVWVGYGYQLQWVLWQIR